MKKYKKIVLILVAFVLFPTGYLMGLKNGETSGARQMARHILNPAFRTDKFDVLVEEEKGNGKDWERAALSWQSAAEHYGGICKWLLENKPIYGKIVMDANTTLSDCLIVSGSTEASVEASGDNILIRNNYFRAIDMDWVVSMTAIDPNAPSGFLIKDCYFYMFAVSDSNYVIEEIWLDSKKKARIYRDGNSVENTDTDDTPWGNRIEDD